MIKGTMCFYFDGSVSRNAYAIKVRGLRFRLALTYQHCLFLGSSHCCFRYGVNFSDITMVHREANGTTFVQGTCFSCLDVPGVSSHFSFRTGFHTDL